MVAISGTSCLFKAWKYLFGCLFFLKFEILVLGERAAISLFFFVVTLQLFSL